VSFLDQFLSQLGSRHTRRAYRSDLRSFFGDEEEGSVSRSQLRDVTESQVRTHLESLRADGKSTSSQRRCLSALRRFFDWLKTEGLVSDNPARECRFHFGGRSASSPGDEASDHHSVLSKSNVKRLLAATDGAGAAKIRDRALLLTILYAALRRAEVAAMDVRHVRPLGRHWVIDLPSGDSWSGAYVKVPEAVVEAVEQVQSEYGIDEGALWRSLSNRNRGDRMSPDAIYKLVQRTGRRAGLSGVTVETLRQTGLHLAMKAGATIQQAQLHGRLQSAASIERLADTDEEANRLSESAADFLDLDLIEGPNFPKMDETK